MARRLVKASLSDSTYSIIDTFYTADEVFDRTRTLWFLRSNNPKKWCVSSAIDLFLLFISPLQWNDFNSAFRPLILMCRALLKWMHFLHRIQVHVKFFQKGTDFVLLLLCFPITPINLTGHLCQDILISNSCFLLHFSHNMSTWRGTERGSVSGWTRWREREREMRDRSTRSPSSPKRVSVWERNYSTRRDLRKRQQWERP